MKIRIANANEGIKKYNRKTWKNKNENELLVKLQGIKLNGVEPLKGDLFHVEQENGDSNYYILKERELDFADGEVIITYWFE